MPPVGRNTLITSIMESIFLIHPRESVSLGQGTRVSQNCFPLNASEWCLIKQPPTVIRKAALYILVPVFHFSPVDILWQALWTYSGLKSEEARWWLSTHIIELYLHPFHSAFHPRLLPGHGWSLTKVVDQVLWAGWSQLHSLLCFSQGTHFRLCGITFFCQ